MGHVEVDAKRRMVAFYESRPAERSAKATGQEQRNTL
jgi:hypothetical protein